MQIHNLTDLGQLPELKEVILDNNMEINIDDILQSSQTFEYFSINNCIYISLNMDVTSLQKCRELNLRKNKIKGISSKADMDTAKINLSANLCVEIVTPERFPNLTELILNNCALTSLRLVRQLHGLKYLDVSDNSLL